MMTEARKGLPVRTTKLSLVRRLEGEVTMTEEEWVLFESKNRSRTYCVFRSNWYANTIFCQRHGKLLIDTTTADTVFVQDD